MTPEEVAHKIVFNSEDGAEQLDMIAKAIRDALADRDHEWWQALALNDAVAPTPEAVKKCVLDYQELAVKEEREACAKVAENEWMFMAGFSAADHQAHNKASIHIARRIRERGTQEAKQ